MHFIRNDVSVCDAGHYYVHTTDENKCPLCKAERLQAIVDKLPKTADKVPVVRGMKLFAVGDGGGRLRIAEMSGAVGVDTTQVEMFWTMSGGTRTSQWMSVGLCYSCKELADKAFQEEVATREAASAAEEK